METFESLWDCCTINNRLIPKDWQKLYNMLKNKRQKPSGGWEPALPLVLAAWHNTMPIEKQLRFKEHIQWAAENGQIEEIGAYIRSLSEENWYHFGEL
jgi:DNA modification methylase